VWGLKPFDIIGVVLAAALTLVFVVSSAKQGIRLAREAAATRSEAGEREGE